MAPRPLSPAFSPTNSQRGLIGYPASSGKPCLIVPPVAAAVALDQWAAAQGCNGGGRLPRDRGDDRGVGGTLPCSGGERSMLVAYTRCVTVVDWHECGTSAHMVGFMHNDGSWMKRALHMVAQGWLLDTGEVSPTVPSI